MSEQYLITKDGNKYIVETVVDGVKMVVSSQEFTKQFGRTPKQVAKSTTEVLHPSQAVETSMDDVLSKIMQVPKETK